MLGSNAGTVHHQRQGTGKATILQSDNLAVKEFLRQDDIAKAQKAANDAARAKAKQDAMKSLTDFNPERWLKHDVAIQGMMDEWVSAGSQIIAAGGNPSNGMDQSSIEWRRKRATIEAASKASMQMKDMFTATRGKIDGSEEDKYDPESIIQMQQYFDLPIDRVIKEGILPPPLLQAKPGLNLQKTWAGLSKDLYDRNKDKPLDEAGKWDFVRASMAADPEVTDAAQSYLHNLPQSEQAKYADRAKKTGRSTTELVNYDFMTRYEPGREPFDLNSFIQKGVESIDVPYVGWETPSRFGKSVDEKQLNTIALERARVMLTSAEALYEYPKLLPMNEGETEGVYRARAVKDLAERMRKTKATSTQSGITEAGQGEKDITESSMRWLRDIKSTDGSLNNEAAGYLFDTPGVGGDMNVEFAQVQEPDANNPASRYLVLTLKGNPTLKEVKEKILQKNGIPTENVQYQTVGTKGHIVIPITNDTENALLRMHDKAFRSARRPYGGPMTRWSADQIINNPGASPVPNKIRY